MNLRENFAPLTINMAGVVIVGIVLVLMQWSSPVLAPIFFAWYLTALAFPFFSAFKQRGMNRGVSLLLLVGGMLLVGLLIGGLMFLGTVRLAQGLETYGGLLDGRQAELESALESINLENSVDSEQLKGLLASLAVMAATVAGNFLFAVALSAFILLESDRFSKILQSATSAHPIMQQMPALMKTAIAYFGIRTRLNLITGVGFTLLLLLLGVDYALLWGILAFFLSYIPYIGLLTAMIPPSLLAYAEFGIGRALIIIAGAVILNLTIENILEPSYTGRRLSLSPSVVFVSFFFWAWLLGPVGAILSMPITVMLLLVLGSDEHTEWLARIISKTGELPQELEAKGSSEKASQTG